MQIKSTENCLMFKQIKLSEAELKQVKNVYKQALMEPKNHEYSLKMFDMFESHLNNEVRLKSKVLTKARKFFAMNLYHKFFTILLGTKERALPFETFFDNLNNFSAKFELRTTDNEKVYEKEFNVTSAKETANYISNFLGISNETYLKFAQKNSYFQQLTIGNFKYQVQLLKNHYGFNDDKLTEVLQKCPYALTKPAALIIDNSKILMKTLQVDDSEKCRDVLINNPDLLCLTNEELEARISDLSEFLSLPKENVIHMIKSKSRLATVPFHHIQSNFYSMQDFLGVNKEKMSEIADVAPITIKRDFINSKENYEKVVKTLGLSLETFFKWANNLPAVYRVTTDMLEEMLQKVSKMLNYDREESINYLKKNLNVLSYRLKSLDIKPYENFELLNQEYGIDSEMYRQLLEKNSWLMGNDKDLTRKNLLDVQAYFNVDKKTLVELFMENPPLITTTIDFVDKYVIEIADFLGLTKDEYKQLCIKNPQLAAIPLKQLLVKISDGAKVRGLREAYFIKKCRMNPEILLKL